MLPTPASSTEIKGQDVTKQLSSLQMSFELPPSAMETGGAPQRAGTAARASPATTPPKAPFFPTQPSETVKSRRRSSAAQKETFALPPPPTRSRKIIQMKPRGQQQEEDPAEPPAASATAATATAAAAAAAAAAATGAKSTAGNAQGPNKNTAGSGSKRKQPSATSAAGRKIARKTAHSLIERRRRSKMNEEFAVLKGLIPACTGEMHKLAILQVRHKEGRAQSPEGCVCVCVCKDCGGGG